MALTSLYLTMSNPWDADDGEPGPTYCVWITEPPDWDWVFDGSFTCSDDPDGAGARQSAHEYARYLRATYHCSYVAVRPAGKCPPPIQNLP